MICVEGGGGGGEEGEEMGRKDPLAGGRIYMGCLINQESRVIGHEVYKGENGRGARVTGV